MKIGKSGIGTHCVCFVRPFDVQCCEELHVCTVPDGGILMYRILDRYAIIFPGATESLPILTDQKRIIKSL